MTRTLQQRCRDLIVELGLGQPGEIGAVTALTGGVASDIASVQVGEARYCVKFALPKLKVAADWHAPVQRNAAEYAWLEVAAKVVPQSAVRLHGRSEAAHGFVMEFVSGEAVYLWKSALLAGQPLRGEAAKVGDMTGRIHAASARPGFNTAAFHNRDDFRDLRIEPYLSHTARAHPRLAPALDDLAAMLYQAAAVLVHGDVSPKNILLRSGAPIILDAECATMGDASFDPAFCLTHLALKALHLPARRPDLLAAIGQFWQAYAAHITWESPAALEARIARLVPALMLARIDGKSPVEYLGETRRAQVRGLAMPLIEEPAPTLAGFTLALTHGLKDLCP